MLKLFLKGMKKQRQLWVALCTRELKRAFLCKNNCIFRLFLKGFPCLIGFYQIQKAKNRTKCPPGAPTTVQCGLVLSAIGDLFLIYGDEPQFFVPGVVFFGCAQVMYTMSFGWEKIQSYTFMMTASLMYGLQRLILDEIQHG